METQDSRARWRLEINILNSSVSIWFEEKWMGLSVKEYDKKCTKTRILGNTYISKWN